MSSNMTNKRLSPYWNKIKNEACKILEREIQDQKSKTVSPEFCLLASDKRLMEKREQSIRGSQAVLETVRQGGFWGKAWALDVVLQNKPGLAFQ